MMFIAISKYEKLVNTIVNGIYVSDYKRVTKVSGSGRVYKVGRLTVAYEASKNVTLEVGLSSWNKQTFYKRLNKLNGKTTSKKQTKNQTPTKQMYEVALSDEDQYKKTCEKLMQLDDCRAFQGCTNMADIKRTYKKLAKIYHPDCGGSEEKFRRLQIIYKEAVICQEIYEETMAKVERVEEEFKEEINKIKEIYDLDELKKYYRKLSKKLHPDMDYGNEKLFKQANAMYRLRKEAITSTLKHTDINDEHYKELVDLEEEIIAYADSIGTYRY